MSDTTPAVAPPEQESEELPPVLGLSFTPRKVAETALPKSLAILGEPKAGKTELAASASLVPQLGKVLILENEAGTATIAKKFPDVDYFPLTRHAGFVRAVEELLTVPHDYGVVVLDTFDKFQEYAETFFLANAGNDTRAAYGKLKKWTLDITDRLHKAPFLTIFLFHTAEVRNERSGEVKISYKLIGSAGDTIGQTFDMIAHLTAEDDEQGETQRVLQLGKKTGVVTGNRWEGVLPRKMVNATVKDIYDIIAPATETE